MKDIAKIDDKLHDISTLSDVETVSILIFSQRNFIEIFFENRLTEYFRKIPKVIPMNQLSNLANVSSPILLNNLPQTILLPRATQTDFPCFHCALLAKTYSYVIHFQMKYLDGSITRHRWIIFACLSFSL